MTRARGLLLVGFLLALVLAGGVSYYASGSPDGLGKVSAEEGFDGAAKDHPLADSPVADYEVRGVDDGRLAGGLAGVIGVVATFAVGGLVFRVVRRPARLDASAAGPVPAAGGGREGPDR